MKQRLGAEVLVGAPPDPALHRNPGPWHIAVCVLAALVEQLIGNRLPDADLVTLTSITSTCLPTGACNARARPHPPGPFTAGEQTTITAVTRRTGLQQQILDGLGVDTAAWTGRPSPDDGPPRPIRHYMLWM